MDLHCMPERRTDSHLHARRGERAPSRRLSATGPIPPDAPLRSAGGTDPVIATPNNQRLERALSVPPGPKARRLSFAQVGERFLRP